MAVPGRKSNKQFPSSITVTSDDNLKLYCQSCDRVGPRLPAHGYCTNCSEHLCDTCFTLHKKHKLSIHHTLLDKANMPQTMSSLTLSHSDNFKKPCPKHTTEMIKYYCHDHQALLCSICVTLEHTGTSCKVNYIPDVSGQVINSREYQDLLKAANDMTMGTKKILQDIEKMHQKSSKSLTDALTDIKKFRTEINQKLDELEKKVEEAAKSIQEENSRNMVIVEKECEDLSKSLKASSDIIAHLNMLKQPNNLFIELKQTEQMIKDYEQSIDRLTAFDVKEYKFEPNEAIPNILSKEKSLGTLKSRKISDVNKIFSDVDKICIKTSKDTEQCRITGMALLTPTLLIIIDHFNNAVKMVDINKKAAIDRQELDSDPWDVSSISQDEIAVTMPYSQTIQFMSVSRNNFLQFLSISGYSLKNKHTTKVDGECRGISCHKDKMVVSFKDPGKVQILLINGTLLQTIQDKHIFIFPEYVTTSDNYIYVSDFDMKTISKLNWQGEVKGKYDCSSKPCGLIMSDDGTVFVCFYDDNTIREISEDFTKEQVVFDGIQGAVAVCWSAETCKLYTSSCTSHGEHRNFIRILTVCK